MIHLPEFLSPDLLRPLGLTLLHFIWQGGALAALAALAMALTKSASARYALGIAALLAMVAAPIVTSSRCSRIPPRTRQPPSR